MEISKPASERAKQLQALIEDAYGIKLLDTSVQALERIVEETIQAGVKPVKAQRDALISSVSSFRTVLKPVIEEEKKRRSKGQVTPLAATVRIEPLLSAWAISDDALLTL